MSDHLMGGMEFLGNTSLTMMIEETVASLGRDMFVLSSYQAPSFVWSIVTPVIVQSVKAHENSPHYQIVLPGGQGLGHCTSCTSTSLLFS